MNENPIISKTLYSSMHQKRFQKDRFCLAINRIIIHGNYEKNADANG
jgi:hypothetical protein